MAKQYFAQVLANCGLVLQEIVSYDGIDNKRYYVHSGMILIVTNLLLILNSNIMDSQPCTRQNNKTIVHNPKIM